jgi:outer membrane protein OmpA-like peptidoglycan-associated protein
VTVSDTSGDNTGTGALHDERGISDQARGTSSAPFSSAGSTVDPVAMTTTSWAIAPLLNVSTPGLPIGPGMAAFSLLHRETWLARNLSCEGVVVTAGLPIGKMGSHDVELPSPSFSPDISYVAFETPRPLAFADFSGMWFRFTTANIGLIVGYTRSYLTLWKCAMYFGEQMAYIAFGELQAMLPGGSFLHGRVRLLEGGGVYGVPTVPRILMSRDDPEPLPEPLQHIREAAREGPIVRLPADTLFDFDKALIRPEAETALRYLLDLINNRRTYPVSIEGHTDATGAVDYNRDLSMRRAAAVKTWLLRQKADGAKDFRVVAYGESQPIASNDTRGGRAMNRRVTVRGSWNILG